MKTDANLSACKKYRYTLWRTWDDSKPYVMFIGLNPSTADETKNDKTITRCIKYAEDWGYGGLCMTNLFAFRATDPSDMKKSKNPIGIENDNWIKKLAKDAEVVVAAWGNDGCYMERSKKVIDMIPNLMCLKINETGEPAHPLYQEESARLMKYK